MSMRPRVVVTRRWPAAVEQVLYEEFDTVLNEYDEPMSRAALEEAMCSADALCVTVTDAIDAALLDIADAKVRLLANFGVGFNHIDLAAAARLGISPRTLRYKIARLREAGVSLPEELHRRGAMP